MIKTLFMNRMIWSTAVVDPSPQLIAAAVVETELDDRLETEAASTVSPVVILAVFALIGLNVRSTFGAVPPLLDDIAHDLSLPSSTVGLLTAVPVLLIGLLAPASQKLAHRFGVEWTTAAALALLSVAELLRVGSLAIPALLFISTVLSGAAMSGVSTLVPALIGHYCRKRPGLSTGIYSTSMAIGSSGAAWITVPLVSLLGSWPRSIASWGLFAAVATVAWVLLVPRLLDGSSTDTSHGEKPERVASHALPWRDRTAQVLAAFTAIQTLLGFSAMTWLAPAYRDLGWSPGHAAVILAIFAAVQSIGMLTLPTFADRTTDRRPLFAVAMASTALGLFLIVIAPSQLAYLAILVFGFGIGGGFAVGMVLIIDYTRDRAEAARLSAMTFFVGYVVASAGPVLIGVIHDATGNFRTGYVVLFLVSLGHMSLIPFLRPGRSIALPVPHS
jgi:CP family cyanate transporter-like MFS transporter